MMTFFAKLIAVAAFSSLAGAQSVNQPPAYWTRTISMELVAPPVKASGEVWDFNPLGGGLVIPGPAGTGAFSHGVGSDRPDMWLVIIDENGGSTAYLVRPQDRAPRSGNPLRAILAPAETSSMARCPNAMVCQYRDIRVPENCFGIVVMDQDVRAHDFMLAGVLYEPGKVTNQNLQAVSAAVRNYLAALRGRGAMEGGPAESEKIPVRPLTRCQDRVCFSDELAGLAGVKVVPGEGMEFMEGIACQQGTFKGTVSVEQSSPLEVQIEVTVEAECGGKVRYFWDFGDGLTEETDAPMVTHLFPSPKRYAISVTPRCYQPPQACEGSPMRASFSVTQ